MELACRLAHTTPYKCADRLPRFLGSRNSLSIYLSSSCIAIYLSCPLHACLAMSQCTCEKIIKCLRGSTSILQPFKENFPYTVHSINILAYSCYDQFCSCMHNPHTIIIFMVCTSSSLNGHSFETSFKCLCTKLSMHILLLLSHITTMLC